MSSPMNFEFGDRHWLTWKLRLIWFLCHPLLFTIPGRILPCSLVDCRVLFVTFTHKLPPWRTKIITQKCCMVQFLASKTLLAWFNFLAVQFYFLLTFIKRQMSSGGWNWYTNISQMTFTLKYISNVSGGKLATYLS